MKHKKLTASIAAIVLIILGVIILSTMVIGWNNSADLQAFLGERYLDALDYDRAIASFECALRIDPKNVNAYQKLAETYSSMGNDERAVETLRSGYVATGSRDLKREAKSDYDIDISEPVHFAEDELVVKQTGLDICFVIDTTGSMESAITDTKENMQRILEQVSAKSEDYRIAIVDYRDFSSRTGEMDDYPARLQMDFTNNKEQIQQGIEKLTLGNGGDWEETVYSGLMMAASLDWRDTAKHVIILIGDAPALSPEPISGYTYDMVRNALQTGNAEVSSSLLSAADTEYVAMPVVTTVATESTGASPMFFGRDSSEAAEATEPEESTEADSADATEEPAENFNISLYGIVTCNDGIVESQFGDMCTDMGGSTSTVGEESSLSDEIVGVIEQVEVVPASKDVRVSFDKECAEDEIVFYQGTQVINTVTLDDTGDGKVRDMLIGTFLWKNPKNGAYGYLTVTQEEDDAFITESQMPDAGASVITELWIAIAISLVFAVVISIVVVVRRIKSVKTA